MSQNTPSLNLPLIQSAQAQKHVTHNEALDRLDALVQPVAADLDRTEPPANATEGDTHLVAAGATGAWAGQDMALARFSNGGWIFQAPRAGWRTWVLAAGADAVFDGAAWRVGETVAADRLGVNAVADATNRLTVSSSATLLTHEGADHQLKINKAGEGDTNSLLFQTNWSGRAEMGCAGSDDFSIKVSDDGASFHEAIAVDRSTGAVRFPNGTMGTGSAAGPMGGQMITITGEEAQSLSVGQYLPMGNGSSDTAGVVLPFSGRVLAATMSVANGPAGPVEVAVAVNKAAASGYEVGLEYTATGVETAVADFLNAPLAVAAGDAVTVQCTAGAGGSQVVVALFVMID